MNKKQLLRKKLSAHILVLSVIAKVVAHYDYDEKAQFNEITTCSK
jgi:hypothetical protein